MNEIRVGQAAMFAVTVPVVSELDEVYIDENEEIGSRVQLLRVNNYWLVILDDYYEYENHQNLICFSTRYDALRYLKLLGFEDSSRDT